MDPIIVAAFITGFASIAWAIVVLWNGRRQLAAKMKEIDLQKDQLEKLGEDISRQMSVLKQEQLRDVLKKRLDTYPRLWRAIQRYWQHWCYDNRPLDNEWANSFLKELYECSEQCGAFFSEPVYRRFHEFRSHLRIILRELEQKREVGRYQIEMLDKIWFGDQIDGPGLATELKNDLGSYQLSVIQSPHWTIQSVHDSNDHDSICASDEK